MTEDIKYYWVRHKIEREAVAIVRYDEDGWVFFFEEYNVKQLDPDWEIISEIPPPASPEGLSPYPLTEKECK